MHIDISIKTLIQKYIKVMVFIFIIHTKYKNKNFNVQTGYILFLFPMQLTTVSCSVFAIAFKH